MSGQHVLLDLSGIDTAMACDAAQIEALLRAAALAAGATPIHAHFHPFGEGQGVTGVLLLKESHISIHTWPEHAYAAADIFMCGEAAPLLAAQRIASGMRAQHVNQRVMQRHPACELNAVAP